MKSAASIYVSNVFRSWAQAFWSVIVGRMFPNFDKAIADPTYIKLSRITFNEVSARTIQRMKYEGITYKNFYIDDFFDCVEFARCFCDYFTQDMVIHKLGVKGKGCPVTPMGFIEKKRGQHACIAVKINNKLECWEPYPDCFRKLDLDKEEIATMRPIGF